MKFNLTKISIALLSAVFILGCQDQGSGPVGPDGLVPQFDRKSDDQFCLDGVTLRDKGHCHGDDGDTGGGDASVSVTMSGGMTTNGMQLMQISEKRKEVRMNANEGDEPYFQLAMNLINTHAAGHDGDNIRFEKITGDILDGNNATLCVQEGRDAPNNKAAEAAFDLLIQPPGLDFDLLRIVVVIDKRGEDHRFSTFGTERLDLVRVRTPNVTVIGPFTPANFTAEFIGGNIHLHAGTDSGQQLHLTCDIQPGDEIKFDVATPS